MTRLDQVTGAPAPGPNNVYVSDNPLTINVRPQIEAGADRTVVGGCDCIVAQYRGKDKLKYFTLEMDTVKLEPGLLEIMLGATAILGSDGNPIGNWWQDQLSCSADQAPSVAFEAWQDLWDEDHQDSTFPYLHWVWPSTYWQIGDFTMQNDFAQPRLTGFSRGNTEWGAGIFGDYPEASPSLGGFFYDTQRPTAECGWQSHAIT